MALNTNWMQNVAYAAQIDRQLIEALVATEGVVSPLSFQVVPQSPAALTVKIKTGSAFVKGDDSVDQGMYCVKNTADITSDSFNLPAGGYKRIDSICLCVKDPDASGPAGNTAAIVRIQGTAVLNASVASPPALPSTHIRLANIEINSATSSITTSNITDQRTLCGGIDHVGTIQQWAGGSTLLPTGWLVCDGSNVSRSTYPELFALLGTTYGSGDGSTTFGIPDLRGRTPVGVGTGNYSGTQTARVLGAKGGRESVVITDAEMPSHSHAMNHNHGTITTSASGSHTHSAADGQFVNFGTNSNAGLSVSTGGSRQNETGYAGNHTHSLTIPSFTGATGLIGGGGAHENMAPFIALNFIIRAA